jgi:hypothetical protein
VGAAVLSRPFLFVAREPDETLRTLLPVLAALQGRGRQCLVLFHHQPGPWALERLAALEVPWRQVALPGRQPPPGPWSQLGLAAAAGELHQLRRTRELAEGLLRAIDPAAVIVIQDTLLLERFLVRAANRRGRGTLVVQWAFTYPQAMYDRLQAVKQGSTENGPREQSERAWWRLTQRLCGVHFRLANSYGGGEARVFAVMGEAFRQQFLAQGVCKERIEVTGHPLHDQAFAQAAACPAARAALRARYGLPDGARLVLYATQPVLWRAVLSREQLRENVRALGRAVAGLGEEFLLVLKLHPRESPADYAGLDGEGLPIVIRPEGEIAELIAPAEVFISSSSSTILQAMMLDKPVVTVNFNQVPHFDYYENIGGTLHVRTPDEAAEALRLAVFDQPTRARLAAERATVLAQYARFDGQATRRLADLVEQLGR